MNWKYFKKTIPATLLPSMRCLRNFCATVEIGEKSLTEKGQVENNYYCYSVKPGLCWRRHHSCRFATPSPYANFLIKLNKIIASSDLELESVKKSRLFNRLQDKSSRGKDSNSHLFRMTRQATVLQFPRIDRCWRGLDKTKTELYSDPPAFYNQKQIQNF